MSTFEKFRPRLKPGQFYATPMAVVFELDDASSQITLPPEAAAFTALIDGQRSIQDIIEHVYHEQRRVPFKALISAIQKLRQGGALENDDPAVAEEFETRADVFDQSAMWWEKPIFSKTLTSRWAPMAPSNVAFLLVAGGATALSLLFLAVFLRGGLAQIWSTAFLKIDGSYLSGIVFFVAAASALVTLKTLFKALLALLLTGRVSQVRLELNLYSLALRLYDDRLYFNNRRSTAALGVSAVALSQFLFFAVVAAFVPRWSHLPDLFIMSLLLALVDLNPYRKSELTSFFNIVSNQSSIAHLLPYLKSRALTAGVGRGEKISDESIYAVYSTMAILWTIASFNFTLTLLNYNYANLLATARDASFLESASAILIFIGIVVVTLSLVFDLARTVGLNLIFPWLNSLLSRRGHRRSEVIATDAKNRALVTTLPLFRNASSRVVDFLISKSETRTFQDGAPIVVQGAESTELFALIEGEAKVTRRFPTGAKSVVATLRAPVLFGENTLLDGAPRSADVVANGLCTAIAIPASALRELEANGDLEGRTEIIDRLRAGQAISSSELFESAPSEAVSLFLDEGELVRVPSATRVIEQGQLDKDFYLLVRGSVEVSVDGVPIRTLAQGDFFGEMALLFDSPRSATITTREDSTLLRLSKDRFWSVISNHMSLALFIESISEQRLREDVEVSELHDTRGAKHA